MEGVVVGVVMSVASIFLPQVEITQADRQSGIVHIMPQGGGAHCGEGAWAEAVGRDNLTACKGREEGGGVVEVERGEQWLITLFCFD